MQKTGNQVTVIDTREARSTVFSDQVKPKLGGEFLRNFSVGFLGSG